MYKTKGMLIYSLEPSFVVLTGCSVDLQGKHPVSLVIGWLACSFCSSNPD